jgi:hypothetical protein
MSYDVFITILLTAITVVLAALAALVAVVGLGVGALALWGYAGLKDEAEKTVSETMDAKLKEYPSALDMIALHTRMKATAEFIEQVQNQIVIPAESKPIETPSKAGVQEGVAAVASAEVTKPSEATIAPYPGEEADHVRQNTEPTPASGTDSRTNPS